MAKYGAFTQRLVLKTPTLTFNIKLDFTVVNLKLRDGNLVKYVNNQ